MFQVTVHNSIHEITPSDWDDIVEPGRILQSYAWLSTLEDGGLVDCPPRYFVVRMEDGQIAAHLAAYMIETSLLIFSQGRPKALVDAIRTFSPRFLRPRILECGSPVSIGNPLCVRPGLHPADVVQPLCRSLDEVARDTKIRIIVVRDFLGGELTSSSEFAKQDYVPVPNLPHTRLNIRWRTFEEYVSSMRSRPRQRLRLHLKIATDAQLETRLEGRLSEQAEQLVRQVRNVNENAKEMVRDIYGAGLYRGLSAGLGPNCRFVGVFKGEHLVAHGLAVTDAKAFRLLFFGREESGAHDSAYFLVLARMVRIAIEERMDFIDLGLTTYLPKTGLGAQMIPNWMFIRIRGMFGKTLVKLFRQLNPVPKIMERKIFKEKGLNVCA